MQQHEQHSSTIHLVALADLGGALILHIAARLHTSCQGSGSSSVCFNIIEMAIPLHKGTSSHALRETAFLSTSGDLMQICLPEI